MTSPLVLAHALAADVPATPEAEEARQAAVRELSKPVYHERPSLLAQVWEWLVEHLRLSQVVPGAPAWLSFLIVALAVAVLLALLILLARRFTLASRSRRASASLFNDERDAATLTRAANEAAQAGDWTTAVVERFRAIIRSLDERGLIEDYPGMTAHEAAAVSVAALGSLGPELSRAADMFDSVRYGEVVSTAAQDEWMRQLASDIAQVSPASAREAVS
ncbi:DUF4129 domain-containing protein [Actinomyces faecalis]|uniref:DUF4129 domain-containing protein n=1 Tax=Actinomyces faecalis TaxID=2722820 RepID=UPI001556CD67|nr:DUF4129 domain-containing protein [Actinomyces faecalis]